jgi:hypothetical protein
LEEIQFLRRLVFVQGASIAALNEFVVNHIATLSNKEREDVAKELQQLFARDYERLILEMGDRYPTVADDTDVRERLTPEQKKWFEGPAAD